jgi:hypothetical protein
MDPQYSVLLFSKYSSNCKRLLDIINSGRVDFSPLQRLCIDNADVRARIKANKQLEINIVPCILSVYPNGVVEKYEADHAFDWVEDIIKRFAPPPPPPVPLPPVPLPPVQQRPPPPQRREEEDEVIDPRTVRRMVPVNREQKRPTMTPLTDIPFDDEEEIQENPEEEEEDDNGDRYKLPKMPKRIRSNDNSAFIEDDELFQGEVVDERKPATKSLKPNTKKNTTNESGIMAKAKQMASVRDMDDTESNPMSKRPIDSRIP